jgi:alkylhydroperoxidase/carboxymuconolactone decarboxylase family protein YurZ
MNSPNDIPLQDSDPIAAYLEIYAGDEEWLDALRKRIARIEAGSLEPKIRELVYVTGYLVGRHGDAARHHQQRARGFGATDDDFRLLLRILDFYRGLRGFQDAQKLVSLWRTGNFPEVKPASEGTVQDTFREVVRTRKYIANGWRVYSADGDWLRLYLQRSDANRKAPRSLDERLVQLLSMAITLRNHRYSNNANDGCIQVHEDKSRALGTTEAEVLEVVQIFEICDSVTTAWEGATILGLGRAGASG